ncbi:hypothetical protein [Pararhizobium sp.]|uniref:hypothetical protein n=1 Tax=Pararhizobium sp. TaxID=1977563 RepID=UPI003D1297C2
MTMKHGPELNRRGLLLAAGGLAAAATVDVGASAVSFTPAEISELNQSVTAIEVKGARLPDVVQAYSDVEAPTKS